MAATRADGFPPEAFAVPSYEAGNAEENEFARWATSQGWSVTKRGWPDFICRRGHEVMCVEVKDTTGLSLQQQETATDLAAHGIPVFLWHAPGLGSPGRKLEPISELTRLLTDEELAPVAAAERLQCALDYERSRTERLEKDVRKLKERLAAVMAERRQERAEQERLMNDFGYLLRQVQDHQRGPGQRGTYTSRLKTIIRRHRDLSSPELPDDHPAVVELRAILDGNADHT